MTASTLTQPTRDLEAPAIYVGTYGKYNSGSLFGDWLVLTDYADSADFEEACYDLHKGEDDPEFMFQDWENIPDQFISESSIDPSYWDYLDTIEASYLDKEVFEAASECGIDVDSVEDAYSGSYSSDEDFAYEMADQMGAINESASWPNNCIDWERAARDLMFDYCSHDGHYFSNNY